MTTREEIRRKGAAIREKFGFVGTSNVSQLAPGLEKLAEEMVFGTIWARPHLALEDPTLAALMSQQRLPQIKRYVGAALKIGVPARTVQEVFIHCSLYNGFPAALNALIEAKAAFAEAGVTVPETEIPDLDADALMALGVETMNGLHQDRAQQGYAAPDDPITSQLYPAAIAYGYGEIWNRPDLDFRQRGICAVASFTSIDHLPQVAKFGQSAMNVGVTKQQVIEAIIQTGPYTGFPRALRALTAFGEALGS
jgi:4-carboxymuconolactone decarboxylase